MTVPGIIALAVFAAFAAGTLALAAYRLTAPLLSASRCPTCRGFGHARLRHPSGVVVRFRCPDCDGTGTLSRVVPDRPPPDW